MYTMLHQAILAWRIGENRAQRRRDETGNTIKHSHEATAALGIEELSHNSLVATFSKYRSYRELLWEGLCNP